MRILVSWLREFVDVTIAPHELGEMLSMRGFEVAAIEEWPAGPAAPGQPPANSAADAVIDLEITPNRPDCLSVLGIAREVATAYSRPLRVDPASRSDADPVRLKPDTTAAGTEVGPSGAERLQVTLDEAELCPRYAALVADVRIGPSPSWLANRIRAGGLRPINSVVDVTNYVLLEMGHPTHAFDLHKLAGAELVIRRARPGERLVTLDGEARVLDADMLVIADRERPQALAGVMGGAASEVSSSTKTIALESAYFKPSCVRRTSKRVGLKTEASARFERGADISAPVVALTRIATLLEQVGAGRVTGPVIDRYPVPREPVQVPLRKSRIGRVLGQKIADDTVTTIFTGLGFDVAPLQSAGPGQDAGWLATVPTSRVDLLRETDLIEEVARHYGYDRLPTTFPALTSPPAGPSLTAQRARTLRRAFVAAGFSEAMTFAFIERAAAKPFADAEPVALAYPLSEKFAVLRPSLLPGLVDSVAHNLRHGRRDVRLFEIGARFSSVDGERPSVAFAWTGAASVEHWSHRTRDVDFFDVKGAVEHVYQALGLTTEFEPVIVPYLVAGRAAAVYAGGSVRGVLGQLAPAVATARSLSADDALYVAELDLSALANVPRRDPQVEPIARHPSSVRDLSILVDRRLPAAEVRGTILATAPPTLVDVREFDRYTGKEIPDDRVSLSFHLTFRSTERTLTDVDVQRAMDDIVTALRDRHGAERR